jgi:hypothetical protein
MPDDRNDYADRTPDTYGKTLVQYPGANPDDLIVVEDVPIPPADYEPLPPGTLHPKSDVLGIQLKLVWQGPVKGTDALKFVRRVYANDRSNQDLANWSIKYAADSNSHPSYIRSYIEPRATYAPRTKLSAFTGVYLLNVTAQGTNYADTTTVVFTPTSGGTGAAGTPILYEGKIVGIRITNEGSGYVTAPTISFANVGSGAGATATAIIQPAGALLVKEETVDIDDPQLNSLYLKVIRVYATLPGPPIVTRSIGSINLTPEKYRRLVRTVETNQPVAADYTFPDGLTGDEVQITLQQETIAEARLKIIEEIIETDEDPLISGETGEFGNLVITEEVVDEGTEPLTGELIQSSKVTALGNGKSIRITVRYPDDLFDLQKQSKSLGQKNLIPEKYRRLIRTVTTESPVPVDYSFPAGLTGDQTFIEFAQKTITEARLTIVEEVIDTDEDPLTGHETGEWGIESIVESVVVDGTAPDSGFLIRHSQVTPLGNGKSIKITVNYPSDLASIVLNDYDLDPETGQTIRVQYSLVDPASAGTGTISSGIVTTYKHIDKYHSMKIVTTYSTPASFDEQRFGAHSFPTLFDYLGYSWTDTCGAFSDLRGGFSAMVKLRTAVSFTSSKQTITGLTLIPKTLMVGRGLQLSDVLVDAGSVTYFGNCTGTVSFGGSSPTYSSYTGTIQGSEQLITGESVRTKNGLYRNTSVYVTML